MPDQVNLDVLVAIEEREWNWLLFAILDQIVPRY